MIGLAEGLAGENASWELREVAVSINGGGPEKATKRNKIMV